MNKRVKVSLCVVIVAIIVLLFMQYFWIDRMFRTEQKQIKTQASLLLNDVLSLEVHCIIMERYDELKEKGIDVSNEGWGGSFEDKTITVYVTYPEQKKIERKCETEEEWYEYMKDIYSRYHFTGIDLVCLDSVYREGLQKHNITVPFVLAKTDSVGNVMEQVPADVDFGRYSLVLDTIPLGIDGKDFLVACFDGSYSGMFRQMRNYIFTSIGVVVLLAVILIYLAYTIFYQKKISEVRENFVNSIVHDLRNPVNYIKKALPRIKTDDSKQKYIDVMGRKNERMSLMIEKLLATSSMEDSLAIIPQTVSVSEYVRGIVEEYNMDNDDFEIRFSCGDASIKAGIDLLHFRNAIMNLIDNAIKYSMDQPDVLVRCFTENKYVCISVEDKGIGIPKEYMRYLFTKNFRVPKQKSLPKYGFGLGLSYVKIVARAHGGDVSAKSIYQKGSEFVVKVPMVNNKN